MTSTRARPRLVCLARLLTMTLMAVAVSLPARSDPPPGPPPGSPPPKPAFSIEFTEAGITLAAESADAHEVLIGLATETGVPIIVDDSVDRRLTLRLTQPTVRDLVAAIARAYGLSATERGGIITVTDGVPNRPAVYLASEIISIPTQYVLAPTAKSLLPIFLQDHVKVNPEANAVILSAPHDVVEKFRRDVAQFDVPSAQIRCSVLMVEFTEAALQKYGFLGAWATPDERVTVNSNIGEIVHQVTTDLTPEFFLSLQALVEKGEARIRARPQITTLSGRQAEIFIGLQRFLSTPIQRSGGGDFFFGGTINFIDAGVRLQITPFTGGHNEIIVDLETEVSTLSAPDPVTRVPEKSTRQASAIVQVRGGETIVIGGLTQEEELATRTKIPLLGDLPLLGQLFRSHDIRKVKTDLVIFITPEVVAGTEDK